MTQTLYPNGTAAGGASEATPGIGVGTLLDGRYELEEVLATGGMGAVFRGRDRILDRPVAIKSLHPHLATTSQAARFMKEGETLAGFSQPNLVAVYDAGAADGLPYLVMEYIAGESLATILNQEGPLDPETVTTIAIETCRGLAYAHGRGVVHRDIKPQNLLLTPGGRVKIVDFGIARGPEAAELTEVGWVMGTAHYLAPEVAGGGTATAHSDLYSLGVVLYRLLTGRLPFEGEDPVAVAIMHRTAPVAPPSSIRPDIPDRLEAVVMRLLEKQPGRRFPHADSVIAALKGEPVVSEPAAEPVESTALPPSAAPLVPGLQPFPDPIPSSGGFRWSDVFLALIALGSAVLILLRLMAPEAAGEPLPAGATTSGAAEEAAPR